jgi:hypothetical protein
MQPLYAQGKKWNQFDSWLEDPRASLDVVVKIILCLPGNELQLSNLFSSLWIGCLSYLWKLFQQAVLRLVNTYKNMA